MSVPRLHHYVPQFYLRRFCDLSGRLWAWDREEDRVFSTAPKSLAAERDFYYLDLYADEDPLVMERQFAELEYDVARITAQWIEWTRADERGTRLPIPASNRHIVSLFLGLQFLRTADFREILASLATQGKAAEMDDLDRRVLHTKALWDDHLLSDFTEYIESAIWIFGKNGTDVPFLTSDNPLAFRTPDNSMWLKTAMFGSEAYVVYPLAPDVVLYCHPRAEHGIVMESLDECISPVVIDEEMVESENSGQVFMASRFVLSSKNDFGEARAFAKTIGTDVYAPNRVDR